MASETGNILLLFGVLALLFGVFIQISKTRRQEEFRQASIALGLVHSAGDQPPLRSTLTEFHLFAMGTSPRFSGTAEGTFDGLHWLVLDYLFGNITNNVMNRYLVAVYTKSVVGNHASLRLKSNRERLARSTNSMLQPYATLRNEYIAQPGDTRLFPTHLLVAIDSFASQGHYIGIECDSTHSIIYRPIVGRVTTDVLRVFLEECSHVVRSAAHIRKE